MLKKVKQLIVAAVVLMLIGSTITAMAVTVSASGHTTPPPADETVEVDTNVEVWDRAFLTTRAKTDNAAATIPNADWRVRNKDGDETNLNRDPIPVYEKDQTVSVQFDEAYANKGGVFNGEDVEVIAAHVEESGQGSVPSSVSDAVDLLTQENVNDNASFESLGTKSMTSDGTLEFDFAPDQSGHYVLFLAKEDGTGFDVTNNEISVDSEATVVGMEHLMVRKGTGTVSEPSSVTRGESVDFDVDATNVAGDNIKQAVVLYDEDKYVSESFVVDIQDDLTSDFDIEANSVLETSVSDVNGVATLEEDVSVFNVNVNDGTVSRTAGIASIVDFIGEEAGTDTPDTKVTGDTVLDGSLTVVNRTSQDTTLTVDTFRNWSTGDYRWAYVAVGDSSQEMVMDTGTVTVDNGVRPVDAGSDRSVKTGNSVSFSATTNNPSRVASYDWDFGNGNSATGQSVSQTYSSTGTYTVTLTVTDESGLTYTDTATITVNRQSSNTSPSPPPTDTDPDEDDPDDEPDKVVEPPITRSNGTVIAEVGDIEPDTTVTIPVNQSTAGDNGTIIIERVNITAASQSSNVQIKISSGNTPPANVPQLGRTTFVYATVNTGNLVNADRSSGQLTFRISQTWLDRRGVAADDIVMYRYSGGSYNAIETTHLGGERFRATTPGFSTFAIGTEQSSIRVTNASLSQSEIPVNQSLNVTAELENTGNEDGTTTLDITANGTTIGTTNVTVPADQTVTETVSISFDSPGTYNIAANNVSAGTVTATDQQTSALTVTSASVSATEITAGESVDVTVTVENTGSAEGTTVLDVTAGGETLTSITVTVPAGETVSETTTLTLDTPGDYEIRIGETSAGSVSVTAAGTPTATPGETTTETATQDGEDGSSPFPFIVGIIIVLLVAILAFYTYQRE